LPAALLIWLLGTGAAADMPQAAHCLPSRDGFLSMRLRGSIEREIHWEEPGLSCTGMQRPDGRGLRVRFAGPLDGGELAVVFAAPTLPPGSSGRGVPVTVTLLDGGGERIYGTQGDDRCQLDEVEQQPVESADPATRSYRISARGFCIAPARALDGDGSVLLTRFDFVGLVTLEGGPDRTSPAPAAPP
jgi:hypothetical protein